MFFMEETLNLNSGFVDIKMSGFTGGNVRQLFTNKDSYSNFLKKFLD